MLNYLLFATRRAIVGGLLTTASAYGALSQSEQAVFSYEPKYSNLKIPEVRRVEAPARAQYVVFACNDVFKARGSLEAQVSDNLHLDLAATLQVQRGQEEIVPKATITYKVSERANAKISYNDKNDSRYSSRMLRVIASIAF